jgi:hypothetical protein
MKQTRRLHRWTLLIMATAVLAGTMISMEDDPARDFTPPDILPVVILQGSDYQMGYQYGSQACDYISQQREAKWAAALQRLSREQITRALKINQKFVEKYTPEWIDFMRGMADGATAAGFPADFEDIMLLNCTLPDPETSPIPAEAANGSPSEKQCSVASAWGSAVKGGGLIGIDTLDTPDVMPGIVIVAFPNKGNAYMCAAGAGEIGDHFLMNNKGLFLGNSGGGDSPRPEDNGYGIAWACSLPYLVRFSDTAFEARDRVMKWQINTPENFHFVDVHGNACVVEKTAAAQAMRKPGEFGEKDFMYSTNNYLCRDMKVTKKGEFQGGHGGFGTYSSPRNKMIWDMFHNYHGLVDVEFAKMVLRFPGNPPPEPPAGGWGAMYNRPTNLWTAVATPDDGDKGEARISTGPAGRILHASIAHDGSVMTPTYRYSAGTHTFYRLRLAKNPVEVAKSADKAAEEEISAAYGKLMALNYTDRGYEGLKDLYGKAVTELFEGRNAFNKAILSDGNSALALLARAASAFARAQAHAREVFEALVPPPTNPSALGLRPFGGDWGTWDTAVGNKRSGH